MTKEKDPQQKGFAPRVARNKARLVLPALLPIGLLLLPLPGVAASLAIDNETLTARYDEVSRTFSLSDKTSGLSFVPEGTLENVVGTPKTESVKDAVFGSGKQILLQRKDGGDMSLQLYRGLPFLLVRGRVRNDSTRTNDFVRVAPVTFCLDLARPVTQLRTMGTGGLMTPDQNPGSYLFLTLAEPATRRGIVAGWLTSDRGSGVLFSEVQQNQVWFKARLDFGRLRLDPGESANLETLAIGFFADARIGQELLASAIARQYRIHLKPPMAGYCTWYSNPHGGASDEQSVMELADFAAKELKPFGFSFIQIDDQWQDGKQRNGPARRFLRARPDGPYPRGMKVVANRFQGLGLRAGIWFLPFAGDYQDPEFKERQNWFARRADGSPFETPWGNTSYDLTRPEVQAYLAEMVRTIHGWGYNYFKMDGLWTGTATEQIYVNDGYRDDSIGTNAPFYNPKKTNLETFRDGLKLLRRAVGPDVFFSGCNVSQNMRTLGGCLGLVDSMRIGPDNGQRWGDYRQEIARNGSGSLITGPVRGSRLYFLNGRVWWNDPDPTYVRASVPLSEARLLTSWVALSGQFYLNSDWLPQLPDERLDIIRRTIPAHGATARPVDYFDSALPRIWLVTDTRQTTRRDVLGLFNWENDKQVMSDTAAHAGLDPSKTYFAFDFWADEPIPSFSDDFHFEVPARSCRAIAVRAAEGHPVLVSTSRHVSQGILEVSRERWNDRSQTLSGTSQVIGQSPYELRIAGLEAAGKHWRLAAATTSSGNKAAGATIERKQASSDPPDWLRVTIRTKASAPVNWSLRFNAD